MGISSIEHHTLGFLLIFVFEAVKEAELFEAFKLVLLLLDGAVGLPPLLHMVNNSFALELLGSSFNTPSR